VEREVVFQMRQPQNEISKKYFETASFCLIFIYYANKKMRILLVFWLTFTVIAGYSQSNDKGFTIRGSVYGLGNKKVYLRLWSTMSPPYMNLIDLDSTMTVNGSFIFNGSVSEPAIAVLEIYGHMGPGARRFILDNSDFSVVGMTEKDKYTPPEILGGKVQEDEYEYSRFVRKEYLDEVNFLNKVNNAPKGDASRERDSIEKDSMQFYRLAHDHRIGEFIKLNPEKFVSLLMLTRRPPLNHDNKIKYFN
jgi:hypothetical protein